MGNKAYGKAMGGDIGFCCYVKITANLTSEDSQIQVFFGKCIM
jgi:hypothetical protein